MTKRNESTELRLRIALLGCGKMGRNHLRIIESNPRAQIVGVADPSIHASKITGDKGEQIRVYSDPSELLREVSPDVVHVVTPPMTHYTLGALALKAGAHVYIEKPFTLKYSDAESLFTMADEKQLELCAGHQLLYEDPVKIAEEILPVIGNVIHIESYFSFRPVRRSVTFKEQLIDILPHPIYLLVHFMEKCLGAQMQVPLELRGCDVSSDGEVRALISRGDMRCVLVVTLRGRPVESYLRIVGNNGSLYLDFVRGTVTKLLGPGASAIDAVLNPYKQAKQIFVESTKAFARLARSKEKNYQGLEAIIDKFYRSIIENGNTLQSRYSVLQTVRLCEAISAIMNKATEQNEDAAKKELNYISDRIGCRRVTKGLVVVTGGTGFLGREVVRRLNNSGWAVRVFARTVPPFSQRLSGVDYHAVDLAQSIPSNSLEKVSAVVHCAAETAGTYENHMRNTVNATRNLLLACNKSGVTNIIHVSSIAVMKSSQYFGKPIDEQTPVDYDNLARGPYVWAKAEAEVIIRNMVDELDIKVKIIRPGPLVDYNSFEQPGRLGRAIGSRFIAFGGKRNKLGICSVGLAAEVIEAYVDGFETAPDVLNLLEPEIPTREELLGLVLQKRLDLKALWIPLWIIRVASPALKLIQKVVFPSRKPLDIYAAFSSEKYDLRNARQFILKIRNKPLDKST